MYSLSNSFYFMMIMSLITILLELLLYLQPPINNPVTLRDKNILTDYDISVVNEVRNSSLVRSMDRSTYVSASGGCLSAMHAELEPR